MSVQTANGEGIQRGVLGAALLALAVLVVLAAEAGSNRTAFAGVIGAFAGIALYHASFGFTSAWRRIVTERRGAGLRAQMVLIAATAVVSFPLIAFGGEIGISARGFILPFGVSAAFGAALFGAGMQLGSGCGSGTLYTAGGGSSRMMVTLAAFIAGSVIGTAHISYWRGLPSLAPTSLIKTLGPGGGLLLTLAVLGAIALASVLIEKQRHGSLAAQPPTGSWLQGPWSPLMGALALALVGIATLAVVGRPWGITAGFALWGAKIIHAAGVPVTEWPYWQNRALAIDRSVFAHTTSVMNFGLMLGAMAAAALAGRYRPVRRLSQRDLATAIIGGLMMGYGARLAFGCNIGGFLGGVISGSVHGWGWLVFGFIGSLIGTRLRQWAGMDPPAKPSPG
ncbi:MAG: YeeE/YedE family protein [Rhizobiales bacterium]|nr:YeeE/YedE family protein [Hyphomicrobiales bacterium]